MVVSKKSTISSVSLFPVVSKIQVLLAVASFVASACNQ